MRRPPPSPAGADEALHKLAWYAQRKPVFTGGNEVTLLRGGKELFAAMCHSIDHAQHSVWLAFYIVSPFGQGSAVLQALKRAARRGVKVHMVVDGFGSAEAPEALWPDLVRTGVELAIYRPMHRFWGLLDASQWRRMHVKLCVVDEAQGFVGGINLIDDHYDLGHGWSDNPRLDYAVQASGPVITPMLHTIRAMWTRAQFDSDWRDDLGHLLQERHKVRRVKHWVQQARLKLNRHEQGKLAQGAALHVPMRSAFVLRDNLRQRRTIEQAALQAIHQARHRVDIVTPYFYPRRAIRLALRAAARRGVTVRLLLQGKVDIPLAAIVARALYAELQHHGVRIFEYQPAFLHAKVLCVDDEWATVGSSNLDPLSLVLNLEANLIVKDRAFVRTLSASLAVDFAQSVEVSKVGDAAQRWVTRARRALVRWGAKLYLRLAGAVGRY